MAAGVILEAAPEMPETEAGRALKSCLQIVCNAVGCMQISSIKSALADMQNQIQTIKEEAQGAFMALETPSLPQVVRATLLDKIKRSEQEARTILKQLQTAVQPTAINTTPQPPRSQTPPASLQSLNPSQTKKPVLPPPEPVQCTEKPEEVPKIKPLSTCRTPTPPASSPKSRSPFEAIGDNDL